MDQEKRARLFSPRGHPPLGRDWAEGEELREQKLQELEEIAAGLLATANQLPTGPDRHKALLEIESFHALIAALKSAKETKK
jgi:hypothetical protein